MKLLLFASPDDITMAMLTLLYAGLLVQKNLVI